MIPNFSASQYIYQAIFYYYEICLFADSETYPYDFSSSCFCSKHGQNSCPTSNIQNNLSTKQVLVVDHGVPVCQCSDFIFQHFLVRSIKWWLLNKIIYMNTTINFRKSWVIVINKSIICSLFHFIFYSLNNHVTKNNQLTSWIPKCPYESK